ncbi:MAG: DUF188 domain-containing protein [Planctomycetes bacterium]|nr:DUF188 domain-containing protein [Planctomycetota bacterium]
MNLETGVEAQGRARRLWIDGDACPVVADAVEIARRHKVEVTIVVNPSRGIPWRQEPGMEVLVARSGPDEADDRIVEGCVAGDLCLTSDLVLASRCLQKGGHAFSPRGDRFTPERMPSMLAARTINAHRRDLGEFGGGPPPLTRESRGLFKRNFHQFLEGLARTAEIPNPKSQIPKTGPQPEPPNPGPID